MKKAIITEFSNTSSEGVTLHLNEKTSLKTGNLKSDTFWVSWDKIGKLLFDNYTDEDSVRNAAKNITREDVFKRICYDYREELGGLLQKFWGRRSDACPLECTEHEKQLGEWNNWIFKGMPSIDIPNIKKEQNK